jgi:outer membrane protein
MQLNHKILTTGLMFATALVTTLGISSSANANDQGDLLVRGRIINVNPNDSSGTVAGIAGSGVTVDSKSTVELDFTYMVRPNIGLELILATTKHDIRATGIPGLDKVAETGVLPPTLTAQYHFAPKATVRPYAGLGINYTLFYSSKTTSALDTAMGASTDISLDNSFGLAAQAGVDIDINTDWFMNLDIKYINITTTADITAGATSTSVDVDINPWVLGIGIGKKF